MKLHEYYLKMMKSKKKLRLFLREWMNVQKWKVYHCVCVFDGMMQAQSELSDGSELLHLGS